MRVRREDEVKIKAIVKRADEEVGHMTWISASLQNLQKHVGGYIEIVNLTEHLAAIGKENSINGDLAVICNDEGLVNGLPFNCRVHVYPFINNFFGDIIICGVDDEELCDVPISLKEWRQDYLGME